MAMEFTTKKVKGNVNLQRVFIAGGQLHFTVAAYYSKSDITRMLTEYEEGKRIITLGTENIL